MSKQETNDIDLAAEAAKPPVGDEAPAKAPAKKAAAKKAAKKKATPKPKGKSPEQIAKEKAAKKAADEKAKAKAKAAHEKAKAAAEKKALVDFNKDARPLITNGRKAMETVGKANLMWTVVAHELRELCAAGPASMKFGELAEKEWGVGKNTATKLANAGRLLHSLTKGGGDKEWLQHMPMSNVNILSTVAGWSDTKVQLAIDTPVEEGSDKSYLRIDTTEGEIAEFNKMFDDNGKKVLTAKATPAGNDDGEGVSESETASPKRTPISAAAFLSDCEIVALSSEEVQSAVLTLLKDHDSETVIDVIEALEAAHNIAEA